MKLSTHFRPLDKDILILEAKNQYMYRSKKFLSIYLGDTLRNIGYSELLLSEIPYVLRTKEYEIMTSWQA
jgi:hypothetical protein